MLIRVAPGVPVTVRRVDIPGVANLPSLVTKDVLTEYLIRRWEGQPVSVMGSGTSLDTLEAAAAVGAHLHPGEAESLREAAAFRLHRMALQREQVARLADKLPLPQIALPFLFNADLGPDEVDQLASAALDGIEQLLSDLGGRGGHGECQ